MLQVQEIIISIAIATQKEKDMFHVAKNSPSHITEFPINTYVSITGMGWARPQTSNTFARIAIIVAILSRA